MIDFARGRRNLFWLLAGMAMLSGCNPPAKAPKIQVKRAQATVDRYGDPLPDYALSRLGSMRFLPQSADRIEYSADGKYLAAAWFQEIGHLSGGIQIFERESGRDVTPAKLRNIDLTGFCWAPKDNRIATSHRNNESAASIYLWPLNGKLPDLLRMTNNGVFNVRWSPRGDRIAAVTTDQEVVVSDLRGEVVCRFPFTGAARRYLTAQQLDFTPDGNQLVAISQAGIARYDSTTGALIEEIKLDAESINVVRIFADGRTAGVGTSEGIVVVGFGEQSPPLGRFGEDAVFDFAVSRDGRWLAGTTSAKFVVWDMQNGKEVSQSRSIEFGVAASHAADEFAFAPKRLRFLQTGTWIAEPAVAAQENQIIDAVIDGTRLWTRDTGSTVCEWDLDTGDLLRRHAQTDRDLLAFVPIAGEQIVQATGISWTEPTGSIEIVDTTNDKVVAQIVDDQPRPLALAYSRTQECLLWIDVDDAISAWDLDAARLKYRKVLNAARKQPWLDRIVVSPEGEYAICCGYDMPVRCLRVQDGEVMWEGEHSLSIFSSAAFTPDSSIVAIPVEVTRDDPLDYRDRVEFIDVRSGQSQFHIDCESLAISAVAVSHDAKLLAVAVMGTQKKEIQIWSIDSQKHLATLDGHTESIRFVEFLPDGRLVSASQDTNALIWDVAAAVANQAGIK